MSISNPKLYDYGKCITFPYTPATEPDPVFVAMMDKGQQTAEAIALEVIAGSHLTATVIDNDAFRLALRRQIKREFKPGTWVRVDSNYVN